MSEVEGIFFSVVVPTRNRDALLSECVASILGQKHDNWELLIIDDGSTDDTAVVAQSYSDERIRYLFRQESDRSKARNLGIDMARGSHVVFVDDDDLIEPNHLLNFAEWILQTSNDTILRSGYMRLYENGDRKLASTYLQVQHGNPVKFAALNMSGVWTLCIPIQCLKEHRFPPGYPHWQDTHLILRLLALFPMVQLALPTYLYRIHNEMGSLKKLSASELMARATINTQAIQDCFSRYGEILAPFLHPGTESKLVAEKWIQYAVYARKQGANHLVFKCLKQAGWPRLCFWRLYLHILLGK